MPRRSHDDLGVSTELHDLLMRSYGVLVGECIRSYGGLTALPLRDRVVIA